MSQAINWYSHILLGLKAKDCSGAFRCYRISKLRELDFAKIRSRGYAFQEEFLYRCARNNCSIVETPIIFEDRIVGQSKINIGEVVRSLRDLFLLGLEGIRETPVTHDAPSPDGPPMTIKFNSNSTPVNEIKQASRAA